VEAASGSVGCGATAGAKAATGCSCGAEESGALRVVGSPGEVGWGGCVGTLGCEAGRGDFGGETFEGQAREYGQENIITWEDDAVSERKEDESADVESFAEG